MTKIIEVTPDGHQTIIDGKESLKKDPVAEVDLHGDPYVVAEADLDPKTKKKKKTLKKSLYDQWELLKAKLSHDEAFTALDDLMQPDEEQAPQQAPDSPTPSEQEQPASDSTEDTQAAPADQPDDSAETEASMKEHGYSDAEIAYILHGHAAPVADPKEAREDEAHKMKLDAMKQKQTHEEAKLHADQMRADQLHEHELGRKTKEHEHELKMREFDARLKEKESEVEIEVMREEKKIELEHQKRMLDLEYQKAKKESEMELELQQQELKFKIKQAALDADMKRAHKDEAHQKKMEEPAVKKPVAKGK
jgi:hypothetical protein